MRRASGIGPCILLPPQEDDGKTRSRLLFFRYDPESGRTDAVGKLEQQ